ncbi:N-acetyl sugar amidotransferase [Pseudoalteromonas denitrificans]|uniref:N-acetyl sugar amidotransferase n=1 Tax=Pseudoalteromonas denitrificans DSM 6059 TaxID=1123010 RepID=A0A1I1HLF5_9GAMM|nr:N-acetyl sugar amidotransferase [Pseudoalteromonas denitrificans]SFC24585.1 N-acetyl sugar amidotransferase [Pseudoalteromonas denitrificans DSM 6059]
MKKCTKCGLPETYETIEFNQFGICNICLQKDHKDESINWHDRKEMLDDLVAQYKGKYDYDCIVPFSGGKDSTFTLKYLIEQYGLKPLVVQFNHGFLRPQLLENNERTLKKMGVDFITFTPNWKLVKRLMLESLIRKGDFCWHCHTGIFSYPMHIAIKFNVPLIFWGEPSSEYTAYYDYRDDEIESVDETRFNRYVNLGITAQDMAGMIKDDFKFDERDLWPFTYPKTRDLKRLGYHSVCLGSFIPWDVKKQSKEIMDELNWQGDQVEGMPWDVYPYEKIECYLQGVRDYIKYLKRGYSRVSQMTALDIRNGRMTKAEADELVEQYEGKRPPSLELFLEYLDLTEDEFNQIVFKTVVPPFVPDFDNIEDAPKTKDFDTWFRESKV